MKYYARQIAPEYQESPLFLENSNGEAWEGEFVITGNRDFCGLVTEDWKIMTDELPNIEFEIENMDEDEQTEANLIDLVKSYFHFVNDEQALEIARLAANPDPDENDYYCSVYTIIAGKEYTWTTIRGCCQGDWQEMFFPAEYDKKTVEMIETEYFNTGAEYMVHDEDSEPETPEDITGYCVYVHEWSDEGIREELANVIGCEPEELAIYNISGSYQTYEYEEA